MKGQSFLGLLLGLKNTAYKKTTPAESFFVAQANKFVIGQGRREKMEKKELESLKERLDRVESTLFSLSKYYSRYITGNDVSKALKDSKEGK